jgi:hypothetical protein
VIGPVDSAIAATVAPTVPGMDDEIPPLLPPDQMPSIHTPQDMFRTWRALMGELGFGRRLLWFGFVSDAGRMAGQLHQVAELPSEPDAIRLDNLLSLCREQLEIVVESGSVAFLLSRPGPGRMTDGDRRWARELAAAASRSRVRLQPIHLATDEALRVFAADDLILPRSA